MQAEKVYAIANDFFDIVEWLGPQAPDSAAQLNVQAIAISPEILIDPRLQGQEPSVPVLDARAAGVSETQSPIRQRRSHAELANGFLGFYALFNNGNNPLFAQFLQRYQSFMATLGRVT